MEDGQSGPVPSTPPLHQSLLETQSGRLSRGSRRSRRASPIRLMPTREEIAQAGKGQPPGVLCRARVGEHRAQVEYPAAATPKNSACCAMIDEASQGPADERGLMQFE